MLQPERPLGMHVLLLEGMQFVPEREPACDDQSNENADQKEPAISRQRDQQNRHNNDRDDEPRRSLQAESRAPARFRLNNFILARLLVVGLLRGDSNTLLAHYPAFGSHRRIDAECASWLEATRAPIK